MLELILGGARSGKSRYAEKLAEQSNCEVCYIATAQAFDEEMENRIVEHKNRRPEEWRLVETPFRLADAIQQNMATERCILVDCLTLWISNLLLEYDDYLAEEKQALFTVLDKHQGHIIFVSNEVGQGIIPMGELNRRFVDESGRLHQEIAQAADQVWWVAAGLPQKLK